MNIYPQFSKKAMNPADLLVIGCFQDDKRFLEKFAGLDALTKDKVHKLLVSKKFSGKTGETFFIPTPLLKIAGSLFLIGLGKKEQVTLEKVRCAAAKSLGQAKLFQYGAIRLDLDTFHEKF